jgi:hypothetical protein
VSIVAHVLPASVVSRSLAVNSSRVVAVMGDGEQGEAEVARHLRGGCVERPWVAGAVGDRDAFCVGDLAAVKLRPDAVAAGVGQDLQKLSQRAVLVGQLVAAFDHGFEEVLAARIDYDFATQVHRPQVVLDALGAQPQRTQDLGGAAGEDLRGDHVSHRVPQRLGARQVVYPDVPLQLVVAAADRQHVAFGLDQYERRQLRPELGREHLLQVDACYQVANRGRVVDQFDASGDHVPPQPSSACIRSGRLTAGRSGPGPPMRSADASPPRGETLASPPAQLGEVLKPRPVSPPTGNRRVTRRPGASIPRGEQNLAGES